MHISSHPWCRHFFLFGFFGLGRTLEDDGSQTISACATDDCDASLGGSLLQVSRQQVKLVEQVEAYKERYDTTCFYDGNDKASRDASCYGNLVCAQKGFDNRNFGDCPAAHCCSVQLNFRQSHSIIVGNHKDRFDTTCWDAGSDTASRDASCKGDLVCARSGMDNRDFGDCATHCCSRQIGVKERFDSSCWTAGSDMDSRDESCKEGLVCAQKGHENRDFGDCPGKHCCSTLTNVLEQYDTACWNAGPDMATRDAACKGALVCARSGLDNRDFGDCGEHCCSMQLGVLEQFDKACWTAGSDMASRDAACKDGLACAQKGYENRDFGDCVGEHCCSMTVRERYDTTCWAAGSDMAKRDASCKGNLVCARNGYDSRNFGDCPAGHCCSEMPKQNDFERYDNSCWSAGSDMASRDASCLTGLVCAKKGFDSRNFGDCPAGHCCSEMPKTNILERYDSSCWSAGSDMASRDASCRTGLVCAKKGYDSRNLGDCPKNHCCSEVAKTNVFERLDTSCWSAGQDMASRDASCKQDLVCALKGYDNRDFGDCVGKHCCSTQTRERYDKTCWSAGSDMASRDASCNGDLTCTRKGRDGRQYGDCPGGHCCSMRPTGAMLAASTAEVAGKSTAEVAGKAVYGVGTDGLVYKQALSGMSASTQWKGVSNASMKSICLAGDTIFGVSTDHKVYKQSMNTMSASSEWASAAAGDIMSIVVHGDTIYAVGTNKQVYKQVLSQMTSASAWLFVGEGLVTSIAISGDVMYGVGTDAKVYKQNLTTLSKGAWTLAGNARVMSIAIDGSTIYGTSDDTGLYKQELSAMTPTTAWIQVANGDLLSVAITSEADPGIK